MERESPFPLIGTDVALELLQELVSPLEPEEVTVWSPDVREMCCNHARTADTGPAQLCGRILAEDVTNDRPFPPFRASVMDGYAVRSEDGPGEVREVRGGGRPRGPSCGAAQYPVVASVLAGINPQFQLQPGQVAYVTTGAPVPEGADAVVKVRRRFERGPLPPRRPSRAGGAGRVDRGPG